jgi:hypothetical protein
MSGQFRLLVVIVFGLIAFRPNANLMAQAVYGSLTGIVTDSTGAVVPGANVSITSIDRRTSDAVESNESGIYSKERLLPGTYEVKVQKDGFKLAVIPSVVVNLDAKTQLNVTLELGEVSETITVTGGEGVLLKTDRADVATTFETRQVTELPILDRNFTKLVLLTPGTQILSGFSHAASENPQGSTQTMVNGQHFSGTGYQLDGTENRDPILGIIVINPNFEAIGETKITSQNYDAEFGQATAGVISVQTKSGTNDLHGSLFGFRQNDVLQARNPFTQFQDNPVTGKAIPDTLRTQFGGAIGGPILRNKLFFFGDYQGTRGKIGGSQLLNVPTLRAREGDLSEYGDPIFDPGTTVLNPDGSLASRQQFTGNIIPAGRLSQQALNLLRLIPLPNAPGINNGTQNNFVAAGSEAANNDTFNVRIDSRLGDRVNLFGRYSYAKYSIDGPTAYGPGGGRQIVSLGGTSDVRNDSIATGFDYTLSPTSILDFRFGFFRYDVDVLPFDFGTTPAADAGVPGLNDGGDFNSGLFAGFIQQTRDENDPDSRAIRFGSGLGVNRCNCPLEQNEKQAQFVGNYSKIMGNHTLKFGADLRRAWNLRVPSDAHRSGELVFSRDRTRGPAGGGLALATFLLGDVTQFTRFASSNVNARERQWRHFYYGQDTWRATPKLTINYGLRLDIINPQTVNEPGNGGFLDLDTGEIAVAGVGGIGLNGDVENSINFAPRLGIAYQLSNKTVIRAGYGRSYDIGVFGSLFGHSVTQNLPVLAIQDLNAPANFERVFTLAEGPSAPVFPTVPSNGRFPLPNGVAARALPEKQRLPTVDAYNVTVQHELASSLSAEIGYVGNKGTHVFAGNGPAFNANMPSLEGFPGVPQNQRRPFFTRFGWTQGIDYFCNCADNHYDSLQAKLTKRFSGSYSMNASYTWSRALGDSDDYFIHDQDLNRGPQDWNRTSVFILSNVIELPFGKNKRFFSGASRALELLVGGWQFNHNTNISSGLPFDVFYRDAGADRDAGPNRPNVTGDVEIFGGQDRYFDTTPIGASGSVFSRPAVGTFGNLPRNDLRGPGFWNTDASLFKRFNFTERTNLEFRVEVRNLWNHVNLGLPDSTIGVPGNDNANAGRITSTFPGFNPDTMRNFQFALKLSF